MRYLYQQLLAFCGMVALILLIVGVSFTQLTKQTIEENNYQQLFGYAESVEKTTQTYADTLPQFSQDQAFQNALLLTEQVLTEQNVNFIFIDKNERVIYPTNTALLNFTLTTDQWKNLRSGRQEKFTSNKNILGQAQATSYALVPFNLNHEFYGALVVSQPARNIDNSVRPITLNLFKGFIFSSIVAVIASYAFAAFQVKRINRLRNATKEVTNGNFDVQLPVHDKDEFDELADDFNKMTNSLKESQAEIEEQENRRRQFMADASHEMRTPLTSIIGYSDTLRHVKLKDEQKDRALEHINREGKRLEALSGKMLQLLGLYQNHAIQMEMTTAGDLLNHVIDMEKEQAEKKAVHLKMECEAFSMKMDPALMESLLINLIDNALKATDAGGSIWVKAYEKAGKKIFEVSDTGMGIPEEELGKITDAFYMVDKSRSRKEGGSGLGLALCVKVAEIHGGCLKIESRQREGTTVRAIF